MVLLISVIRTNKTMNITIFCIIIKKIPLNFLRLKYWLAFINNKDK